LDSQQHPQRCSVSSSSSISRGSVAEVGFIYKSLFTKLAVAKKKKNTHTYKYGEKQQNKANVVKSGRCCVVCCCFGDSWLTNATS